MSFLFSLKKSSKVIFIPENEMPSQLWCFGNYLLCQDLFAEQNIDMPHFGILWNIIFVFLSGPLSSFIGLQW